MENKFMVEWKKNCIRIGAPTNLLAVATSFIPVLWLCAAYDCWPALNTVLTAWGMVALSFGASYFVEPISYYAALGMSGTYLSFLSGNIGNMRVPVAAMALDSTESQPGTLQAEVASTMAICGSIITNLVFTTMAAIVGAAVVSILPEFIVTALTKYAAAAIFGGTFGNFAIKYPKIAVFAIGIPFVLKMTTGLPAWVLIVASVFGSLAIARFFYNREGRAA
ncbi:hypothetical protein [Cloacibacillus porcorum]